MSSVTNPTSAFQARHAPGRDRSRETSPARRAWLPTRGAGADAWLPEPLILRASALHERIQPDRGRPVPARSGPTQGRPRASRGGCPPVGVARPLPLGWSSRDARTVARARRSIVLAFVVLVVTTIPALVEGLGGGHSVGAERSATPEPVAAVVHHVEPGDTLWAIARRIEPDGEVRGIVDALSRARRGLPLQPGEAIRWPVTPEV